MAQPALSVFQSLDQALAAAVARVAPSLVQVRRRMSGGSGIAWSQDLVVSASFHTPDKTQVGVAKNDDIEFLDAEVIGRDRSTDVALLRVAGANLTPAPFRELGDLAVGNMALAVGRPGRSVRASLRAIGVLGTDVELGGGHTIAEYIETDRQIPGGFAGGALVDSGGDVIGMNTRTLVRRTDLAIGGATLKRVVTALLAHGGIRRGFLGVAAYPVQGGGALIASVDASSPAATAGLLVGDILTDIAGTAITGPESLRATLAPLADQTVDIGITRAGAKQTLSVTLGHQT
jgi:S1-C subfamily serine protease